MLRADRTDIERTIRDTRARLFDEGYGPQDIEHVESSCGNCEASCENDTVQEAIGWTIAHARATGHLEQDIVVVPEVTVESIETTVTVGTD